MAFALCLVALLSVPVAVRASKPPSMLLSKHSSPVSTLFASDSPVPINPKLTSPVALAGTCMHTRRRVVNASPLQAITLINSVPVSQITKAVQVTDTSSKYP